MDSLSIGDGFFKHLSTTEGIGKNANSACKLPHITEADLEKSIKDQKLDSVYAVRIYNNHGVNYSAKITLVSANNEPGVYLLTSDGRHTLFYESIDNMVCALRACGYNPQERELIILSCFSEI